MSKEDDELKIKDDEEEEVKEKKPLSRGCTCEYCGCRLTSSGEIISLGKVAKEHRDSDDQRKSLQKRIDSLVAELAEAKPPKPEDGEKKAEKKGWF